MIQQSAKTHCRTFQKNPCPIFYRSTEAYKCKCLICYEKKNSWRKRTVETIKIHSGQVFVVFVGIPQTRIYVLGENKIRKTYLSN